MIWVGLAILVALVIVIFQLAYIGERLVGITRAMAVLAGQLAERNREVTDLLSKADRQLREIASNTEPYAPDDDPGPI